MPDPLSNTYFDSHRKEVGDAIKKSGVDRSEFFVTTKIIGPAESLDFQETYDALVKGVEAFGLGWSVPFHHSKHSLTIC